MCFEPMSLIDPDKLFKHQPEFAASIGVHDTESWLKMLQTNGSTLNYLLTGNLTIKQITDLLYETGRFIESVELSAGGRKPVLDLCKVKRFYNAGHTCILLQFNHSKSQELDPHFELKNNKNFLARISVQQGIAKHIPRAFSTLVEPDTLPWDHKATWVNLPLQQEPSRIPIDFRTMKNEYLPHPYR
uniref:Uncharacterized protein n=1 Tax=Tetranychus urticae TaxID=32264 RepID=T1JSR7_TETUR